MNILIINLTRFGDLLQTQPLISGLSDQGHRVGLVCLEQFAPATALLADVSFSIAFPGSGLLKDLEEHWPAALSRLHSWRSGLRADFRPELIINLTPTLSARMLTRYLCLQEGLPVEAEGATQKGAETPHSLSGARGEAIPGYGADAPPGGEIGFLGFGLDRFGFMDNSSAWATYMQAASRTRGNSPCNLVDVFRKICGLGEVAPRYTLRSFAGQPQEALRRELALQAETGIAAFYRGAPLQGEVACSPSFRGFAAFQLGASDDRRRWPTGYFARLGDLLWEKLGLLPLLLGSGSEAPLGERYAAKARSPHLNLLGGTDLPGLAGALGLCELLVTNDTGTMHLAAGLGLPVLAIFLATAQAWDTAPYQEGVLCLEPDLPDHPRPFDDPCPPGCPCRSTISAETAFYLLQGRLNNGVWPEIPAQGAEQDNDADGNTAVKAQSSGVRAWLTMRPDRAADPEGFLDLKSLSGHEETPRTFWLRCQRYFLRALLDGRLRGSMSAADPLPARLPPHLEQALPQMDPAFLAARRAELDQAAALLHLLMQQGQALSVNPLPLLKNRFMGTWQRLQALWENSPYFNVLSLLWMAQTQAEGDALDKVLGLAGEYATLCQLWSAALALPA